MWFEKLTGFKESTPADVRSKIIIEGSRLISMINHRVFEFGKLEWPSLKELKELNQLLSEFDNKINVSEVIGDTQILHSNPENQNAVFQVASQFNLLEMVNPTVTPERGIDRYEYDFTQGPASAIACGAGTIYRNYFVPINNQLGQSENCQINCLEEIEKALDNDSNSFWEMKNGYSLMDEHGIRKITEIINGLTAKEYEQLKDLLKIGIQWETEVTIAPSKHLVTQVYCSALPISYCFFNPEHGETFAKFILQASYEATFHVALQNYKQTGCRILYLTMVGGGAFGNNKEWIIDAIKNSLIKFKNTPLDVRIVSFNAPNPALQPLIKYFT